MNEKQKLYLAHNFALRFKVKEKIQPIIQKIFPDYDIENPFLRDDRENQGLFDYEGNSEEELSKLNQIDNRDELIVENDLKQVFECDLLVAYIENISFGTTSEIFYNSHILQKPTIIIFETMNDLYYHPWIQYLSDRIILLDELELD